VFLLIEDGDEISRAQRRLESTMRREFRRKVVKNIGYPGGSTANARVCTDGNHWYWSSDADADVRNPCRLNWFGVFSEHTGLGITVEINTPLEGRNDQVRGFFARDAESGSVYLFHSGRVGGGTRGVGKIDFLASRSEPPITVVDRLSKARRGLLVMPVQGRAASRSATLYIDSIAKFKRDVRAGLTKTSGFARRKKALSAFYSEGRGRRRGFRSGRIDYVSRHGDVVDALYSWRFAATMPSRSQLTKSVFIDLGVAVSGKLVEVFEVKTSTSRSDVYTAIGQLFVHGGTESCRKIIVLPAKEPLLSDIKRALRRLNIEILRFKLNETTVRMMSDRQE
jgi:hypothetical protein